MKAVNAITNKIERNTKGQNRSWKYIMPPNKIKEEAINEMANTFNANITERSLKIYNPIDNKNEQTNIGNTNPKVKPKSKPH